MSKRQTRRSISVPKVVYERLKAVAEGRGVPIAMIVENLLRAELGMPPREDQPARALSEEDVIDALVKRAPRRARTLDMPEQSPAELRVLAQQEVERRERAANVAEKQALDNPCRSSARRCVEAGLHEVHLCSLPKDRP